MVVIHYPCRHARRVKGLIVRTPGLTDCRDAQGVVAIQEVRRRHDSPDHIFQKHTIMYEFVDEHFCAVLDLPLSLWTEPYKPNAARDGTSIALRDPIDSNGAD